MEKNDKNSEEGILVEKGTIRIDKKFMVGKLINDMKKLWKHRISVIRKELDMTLSILILAGTIIATITAHGLYIDYIAGILNIIMIGTSLLTALSSYLLFCYLFLTFRSFLSAQPPEIFNRLDRIRAEWNGNSLSERLLSEAEKDVNGDQS